jgi:biopolymer transport protein ExbB
MAIIAINTNQIIMNKGYTRILFTLALALAVLHPELLVTFAQAQEGQSVSFLSKMVSNLGLFLYPFMLLLLAGVTLMIYNGIAIRKKAFTNDEVVQPIIQELQNLNIDGAIVLCEQYKLPVTSVMKAGLSRIQDDELDIESIEKGIDESSGIELAKPFNWINLLNTIGSIAPMVGLLGTVAGMIGAFDVLATEGAGGDASKDMAGNIGAALWTTAAGLIVAIPTLISYFIYKTRFGTIAAEVNRVAGDMVFTLVRAARGGFDEAEEGEYVQDEGMDMGVPAPGAPPMPPS